MDGFTLEILSHDDAKWGPSVSISHAEGHDKVLVFDPLGNRNRLDILQ